MPAAAAIVAPAGEASVEAGSRVTLAADAGIGIGVAVARDLWLLVFVAFGSFVVVAYNLELFGGRFHNDVWFALAWGAFPLLTAYFVSARTIAPEAALAASFAALLSHAQRLLSTPVREVRRRVTSVGGTIVLDDGGTRPVDAATLIGAPEQALRVLVAAVVTLAAAALARAPNRALTSLAALLG